MTARGPESPITVTAQNLLDSGGVIKIREFLADYPEEAKRIQSEMRKVSLLSPGSNFHNAIDIQQDVLQAEAPIAAGGMGSGSDAFATTRVGPCSVSSPAGVAAPLDEFSTPPRPTMSLNDRSIVKQARVDRVVLISDAKAQQFQRWFSLTLDRTHKQPSSGTAKWPDIELQWRPRMEHWSAVDGVPSPPPSKDKEIPRRLQLVRQLKADVNLRS